jgi:exosome complex component RRP42
MDVITEIRRNSVYDLIKEGRRVDDRAFDEYREINVETDIISKAEGSAKVKIGDTQVLVGVKMQPGEPFSDTPEEGALMVNAELIPLASPSFELGPPDENAIEIARIVDRGIRESGAIDLTELCIEEGKKVWLLYIDVHVLDHDGNLMDTSALGAIASLLSTHIPNERYGLGEDEKLSVMDIPVAITAAVIEDEIVLDPDLCEEKIASTVLTVTSNKEGSLSGIQKSGFGDLTNEQLNSIIDLAIKKAGEIRNKLA